MGTCATNAVFATRSLVVALAIMAGKVLPVPFKAVSMNVAVMAAAEMVNAFAMQHGLVMTALWLPVLVAATTCLAPTMAPATLSLCRVLASQDMLVQIVVTGLAQRTAKVRASALMVLACASQALPAMLAKRRCAHLTVAGMVSAKMASASATMASPAKVAWKRCVLKTAVGMVFVVPMARAHAVGNIWVRIVLNGPASRSIAIEVFAIMASASALRDTKASFVKKCYALTIAVPMVLAQPLDASATLDSVDLTAPSAFAHHSVAMARATRPPDCAVAERATLARRAPLRPARKTAMGVALVWMALVSVRSWFHSEMPVSTSSAPTTARAVACAKRASVLAMKASKARTVRQKYAPVAAMVMDIVMARRVNAFANRAGWALHVRRKCVQMSAVGTARATIPFARVSTIIMG